METNEKKYEKLIKDLKSLRQVKAPANFEADLKRRIYAGGVSAYGGNEQSEKYKPEEKSFWSKAFLPSRLIPSLGLAAAAVVVFLVVNINSEEMDNPFLIEPRLREDVIAVSDYDSFEDRKDDLKKEQPVTGREETNEVKIKSKDQPKVLEDKSPGKREDVSETETMFEEGDIVRDEKIKEPVSVLPESTLAEVSGDITTAEESSELATGMAITKEELNFRQVQLSEKEQQEVDELRMKVQSLQDLKTKEAIKQQQ